MTEEIFKIIEDCPNYMISSYGRVMNIKRGKFLSLDTKRAGYKQVGLMVDGIRKKKLVHRLVAIAFIPNLYDKPEVNHIDEVTSNNHVSNLNWMTSQENVEHSLTRTYLFIAPSGEKVRVFNLRKFCEEQGLDNSLMHKVLKGTRQIHKGWTA